jgi:hypothetical protein
VRPDDVCAPATDSVGARNGSDGNVKHCDGVIGTGQTDGAAALPLHGSAPVWLTLYFVRKS